MKNNYGKTVTIRLLKDKEDVYEEFKRTVIDVCHSDICYVTTSLMEAFTQAMLKAPNHEGTVELNMVKQNVQINIGCNFNYNVKRAKRIATESGFSKTHKNYFWPELIEQWDTMTEKNKAFWRNELQNKGIIETPPLPLEKPKPIKNFLKKAWCSVRQLFAKRKRKKK